MASASSACVVLAAKAFASYLGLGWAAMGFAAEAFVRPQLQTESFGAAFVRHRR